MRMLTNFVLLVAIAATTMVSCERESVEPRDNQQETNALRSSHWKGSFGRQGENTYTDDNGEEQVYHWGRAYFVKISFADDSTADYSVRVYESNDGPYGDGMPHLTADSKYQATYSFAGDTGCFYGSDDIFKDAAMRLVGVDSLEINSRHGWIGFTSYTP